MASHGTTGRRGFLRATAAAAGAVLPAAAEGARSGKVRILGVACSPRGGKTTSRAVQTALDAARGVDPRIETELIDLGGLKIAGYAKPQPDDDFTPLLAKLKDPAVGGLIIGSPSYYRAPSSLCRAFIERCGPLREPDMVLANKPVGVVAVGGFRNGGQELVIAEILTSMLCFGMVPYGGNAPAFQGATVMSKDDDIAADELGLDTARKLGARIAAAALRWAGLTPPT